MNGAYQERIKMMHSLALDWAGYEIGTAKVLPAGRMNTGVHGMAQSDRQLSGVAAGFLELFPGGENDCAVLAQGFEERTSPDAADAAWIIQ